ncbi:MAG: hypothetical protein ACOXZW_04250 [Bacilli bacterium]|jgi:hypothetical protein|nr:hypothetical protein [Bacilli bacterium]
MPVNKPPFKTRDSINEDLKVAQKNLKEIFNGYWFFSLPALVEAGSIILTKNSFIGSIPQDLLITSSVMVVGNIIVSVDVIRYYNQIKYIKMVKALLDSDLPAEITIYEQLKGVLEETKPQIDWVLTMRHGLSYINNYHVLPLLDAITIRKNVQRLYKQTGINKMDNPTNTSVKKVKFY